MWGIAVEGRKAVRSSSGASPSPRHPCLRTLSYPLTMRVLLLALMIAILPVRGWLGNAMALDMATAQLSAAQAPASTAVRGLVTPADLAAASAMPEDCPMSAGNSERKSMNAGPSGKSDSSCNCNSCELCMSLASFDFTTIAAGGSKPFAGHAFKATRFSSAERVSRLKPPIS